MTGMYQQMYAKLPNIKYHENKFRRFMLFHGYRKNIFSKYSARFWKQLKQFLQYAC
jgi:hypothetical protein